MIKNDKFYYCNCTITKVVDDFSGGLKVGDEIIGIYDVVHNDSKARIVVISPEFAKTAALLLDMHHTMRAFCNIALNGTTK